MLKVCTGSVAASTISATTIEESIPPESRAPSGTSDAIRRAVALRSSCRTRS